MVDLKQNCYKWLSKNGKYLCYTIIAIVHHFVYVSFKPKPILKLIIFITNALKGISNNLPCATLSDLGLIFAIPLDTIPYLQLAIACGYVLGTTVGWTYQIGLNRQLILIVSTTVHAFTIAIVSE